MTALLLVAAPSQRQREPARWTGPEISSSSVTGETSVSRLMRIPYLLFLASQAAAQGAPLRLVREFTIDAQSGVNFGVIVRIDIGPDGSIAAADNANGVIYRFTPAGKLRDSLGHKGQGPGEFLIPAGLAIGPTGEVAMVDLTTRRLTVWNPDGKLQDSWPIPGGMPIDILWRGPDPVIGVMNFKPGIGAEASFSTAVFGDQFKFVKAVASFPDPRPADLATAVTCGLCRRALSPAGNLLAASADTFYRVSELSPTGQVLRRWTRAGVRPGERTPEEQAALARALARRPGGGRPNPEGPRPAIPGGTAAPYRWRFQGIGLDGSGRLLALASNAGSSQPVLDVFSGDGKFLGTVPVPGRLTFMVLRGSRMVGLSETADGEHQLVVYRIE